MFEIKPLKDVWVDEFVDYSTDDLQRTKEWLEARRGHYTGSNFKKLMGCGRSTSQQPWGSVEKLVDFGALAERYIYQVGKERTRNLLSMETHSKQMNYGKEKEPLFIEKLISDGIICDFIPMGFEEFAQYKNGGASVDGVCVIGDKAPKHIPRQLIGKKVALETKCTVSWDGHYNRMYEPIHDKHDDFWQFQAEMLSVGLDGLLYAVAEPMTIETYDVQITKASPIHQSQMVHRCKIADNAVDMWDDLGYKQALIEACANYVIN